MDFSPLSENNLGFAFVHPHLSPILEDISSDTFDFVISRRYREFRMALFEIESLGGRPEVFEDAVNSNDSRIAELVSDPILMFLRVVEFGMPFLSVVECFFSNKSASLPKFDLSDGEVRIAYHLLYPFAKNVGRHYSDAVLGTIFMSIAPNLVETMFKAINSKQEHFSEAYSRVLSALSESLSNKAEKVYGRIKSLSILPKIFRNALGTDYRKLMDAILEGGEHSTTTVSNSVFSSTYSNPSFLDQFIQDGVAFTVVVKDPTKKRIAKKAVVESLNDLNYSLTSIEDLKQKGIHLNFESLILPPLEVQIITLNQEAELSRGSLSHEIYKGAYNSICPTIFWSGRCISMAMNLCPHTPLGSTLAFDGNGAILGSILVPDSDPVSVADIVGQVGLSPLTLLAGDHKKVVLRSSLSDSICFENRPVIVIRHKNGRASHIIDHNNKRIKRRIKRTNESDGFADSKRATTFFGCATILYASKAHLPVGSGSVLSSFARRRASSFFQNGGSRKRGRNSGSGTSRRRRRSRS